MNDLHIPGSQSTPHVTANFVQGRLFMGGDSYPENSFEFFTPVIHWIEKFLSNQSAPLCLELGLVYMNTSSVKAMMDIFDLLESAHGKGRAVRVDWFYDAQNERVKELAEEFREDYTFPFLIAAHA